MLWKIQAFQSIHVAVKTQVFTFFLKIEFFENKCYFFLLKHFLQVKTVIAFHNWFSITNHGLVRTSI
jgi:hypothetical protein